MTAAFDLADLPDMSEEWVFTGEASRLLGVSEATVRRWADEGLLRTRWTKPENRGRRKISTASIEDYLRTTDPDRPVSDI